MTQLTPTSAEEKVPLWRDERALKIALQVGLLLVLLIVFLIMTGNMNRNLAQQGRQFNFNFLWERAGFNIGETLIPYQPNDPYYWAFFVGIVNTLRLIFVSFIGTTVLGVAAGILSFSDNWLLRKLNLLYVEVVRNTPPLLQFAFWYFAVFFALSQGTNVTRLLGTVLISKKGIWIPWPANTSAAWLSFVALIVLSIAAYFVWSWRIRLMEEQGASGKPQQMILIATGIVGLLIFLFGLGWSFPAISDPKTNDITGGLRMTLEYAAMMMGLSFYTGAFVAEIVRAGIQSVSKGQWEAARSLGLPTGLLMRLVVLPQALRVIVPSLNSQYITLNKNSSLALAIGYPDTFASALTTLNQTGRALEVVMIMVVIYLVLNLIISIIMNQFNSLVQIKER
jgi:general L-amino acid transport system permease protein